MKPLIAAFVLLFAPLTQAADVPPSEETKVDSPLPGCVTQYFDDEGNLIKTVPADPDGCDTAEGDESTLEYKMHFGDESENGE